MKKYQKCARVCISRKLSFFVFCMQPRVAHIPLPVVSHVLFPFFDAELLEAALFVCKVCARVGFASTLVFQAWNRAAHADRLWEAVFRFNQQKRIAKSLDEADKEDSISARRHVQRYSGIPPRRRLVQGLVDELPSVSLDVLASRGLPFECWKDAVVAGAELRFSDETESFKYAIKGDPRYLATHIKQLSGQLLSPAPQIQALARCTDVVACSGAVHMPNQPKIYLLRKKVLCQLNDVRQLLEEASARAEEQVAVCLLRRHSNEMCRNKKARALCYQLTVLLWSNRSSPGS